MDKLTGLETYRVLPSLELPTSGTLAVAFDVAGLRQVNQHFGVDQGDRTLIAVANLLLRACAPYAARPIRYNGEEFLVLLDLTSEKDAIDFALSTLEACVDLRLPFEKNGNSREFVALNAVVFRVFPETLVSRFELSELVARQIRLERLRTGTEAGVVSRYCSFPSPS